MRKNILSCDVPAPIWFCFRWSFPCREPLPDARCALTAPFHLFPANAEARRGSLFSVALFVGLPRPGITRHRFSVKPGLSSRLRKRPSGPPTKRGISHALFRKQPAFVEQCAEPDASFRADFPATARRENLRLEVALESDQPFGGS